MKFKKFFSGVLIIVGTLAASTIVHADEILLGRTILLSGPPGKMADVPIIGCRKVDAIRLQAVRGLRLNRVKLKFQNGQEREFQFQRELGKREKTMWRPLAFPRCVTHVKVYGYSKHTTSGIKVYGRQK